MIAHNYIPVKRSLDKSSLLAPLSCILSSLIYIVFHKHGIVLFYSQY